MTLSLKAILESLGRIAVTIGWVGGAKPKGLIYLDGQAMSVSSYWLADQLLFSVFGAISLAVKILFKNQIAYLCNIYKVL